MLIIVRVGLGFSWAEPAGSHLGVSVAGLGPVAGMGMGARGQNDGAYPLAMISLNVTRTVERETDFALPRAGMTKGDGDSDTMQDVGERV